MSLSEFETQVLLDIQQTQRTQGETLVRIEARMGAIEKAHVDRSQRDKAVVAGIASVIAGAISGLLGVLK